MYFLVSLRFICFCILEVRMQVSETGENPCSRSGKHAADRARIGTGDCSYLLCAHPLLPQLEYATVGGWEPVYGILE